VSEERDGREIVAMEDPEVRKTVFFALDKPPGITRIAVVGESTGVILATALRTYCRSRRLILLRSYRVPQLARPSSMSSDG
jgi:hypothetical protein